MAKVMERDPPHSRLAQHFVEYLSAQIVGVNWPAIPPCEPWAFHHPATHVVFFFVFVADMVVFALAHWLTDLGPVVNVILAVVAALFAIVLSRQVLKKYQLQVFGVSLGKARPRKSH